MTVIILYTFGTQKSSVFKKILNLLQCICNAFFL
nr:MAG TPA: hypothetical protein [Caudoviricetes sp.]